MGKERRACHCIGSGSCRKWSQSCQSIYHIKRSATQDPTSAATLTIAYSILDASPTA